MDRIDITKNKLSVQKISNVIKSNNPFHHKLFHIKSRRSDAFVYILSGSCTYCCDGDCEFTAKEGDVLYLAHQSDYTMYIHSTNYRFIFCDFEFNENSPRKSALYSPENVSHAENLFRKLLQCYGSSSEPSFAESMSLLYQIYGVVLLTARKESLEAASKRKITEAKEYMDANLKDTTLSVSYLAEKAEMSEVYFRKLFQSRYQLSPSQYLISIRLKKAKELMRYPFLTLEECALQSGFSSLQYFCRVFKKSTGITPSGYRNQKW